MGSNIVMDLGLSFLDLAFIGASLVIGHSLLFSTWVCINI